jgi:hypothetical protein
MVVIRLVHTIYKVPPSTPSFVDFTRVLRYTNNLMKVSVLM